MISDHNFSRLISRKQRVVLKRTFIPVPLFIHLTNIQRIRRPSENIVIFIIYLKLSDIIIIIIITALLWKVWTPAINGSNLLSLIWPINSASFCLRKLFNFPADKNKPSADGWSIVVLKWDGLDWLGWYLDLGEVWSSLAQNKNARSGMVRKLWQQTDIT